MSPPGRSINRIALIIAAVFAMLVELFDPGSLLNRMHLLSLLFLLVLSTHSFASDADEIMQDLVWQHRVLIVFTPDPDGVALNKQNAILASVPDGLSDRDMVIIRVTANGDVTIKNRMHASSASSFYKRYNVRAGQFRVVLVGKDGTVKLDQSEPVTTSDLFALIDSMPMRQYEMLQDDN